MKDDLIGHDFFRDTIIKQIAMEADNKKHNEPFKPEDTPEPPQVKDTSNPSEVNKKADKNSDEKPKQKPSRRSDESEKKK